MNERKRSIILYCLLAPGCFLTLVGSTLAMSGVAGDPTPLARPQVLKKIDALLASPAPKHQQPVIWQSDPDQAYRTAHAELAAAQRALHDSILRDRHSDLVAYQQWRGRRDLEQAYAQLYRQRDDLQIGSRRLSAAAGRLEEACALLDPAGRYKSAIPTDLADRVLGQLDALSRKLPTDRIEFLRRNVRLDACRPTLYRLTEISERTVELCKALHGWRDAAIPEEADLRLDTAAARLETALQAFLRATDETDGLAQDLTAFIEAAEPLQLVVRGDDNAFLPKLTAIRALLTDGTVARAQSEARHLYHAMLNHSSFLVQARFLDEEQAEMAREAAMLERQIACDTKARFRTLSASDRAWIAQQLARAASDCPFTDLLKEARYRLSGVVSRTGAWYDCIAASIHLLDRLVSAQKLLTNDSVSPEARLAALEAALAELDTFHADLDGLDRTQMKPSEFAQQLARLPQNQNDITDPGALADLRQYECKLRASYAGWSPSIAPLTQRVVVRRWYGVFYEEITARFSQAHLREALEAAISLSWNPDNLRSRIEQRRFSAARKEALQKNLARIACNLARERIWLVRRQQDIDGQIKEANCRGRDLQTDYTRQVTPDLLKPFVQALNALRSTIPDNAYKKPGGKGLHTQVASLQVEAESLQARQTMLTGSAAEGFLGQAAALLDRLPAFLDPKVVDLGSGKKERDSIAALGALASASTGLALKGWNGLTLATYPADTVERDAIRAAESISMAPAQVCATRHLRRKMESNVHLSSWDILQIANLFYGFITFSDNYNTMIGRPIHLNDPKLKSAEIPAATGVRLVLGLVNAGVNFAGAKKNIVLAVTGERPAESIAFCAAHLDPGIFRGIRWDVLNDPEPPRPGFVYFQSPALFMRSPCLSTRYKEALRQWTPTDSTQDLNGRFFVVSADGKPHIYMGGHSTPEIMQQVNRLLAATVDDALGIDTLNGLKNQMTDLRPGLEKRILAGIKVFGVFQGAWDIYQSIRYRRAIRSRRGGWVDMPLPEMVATVMHKGSPEDVWKVNTYGNVYYERRDEKGIHLDSSDGTVQFTIGGGSRLFGFDVRHGFWMHASNRGYVPSLTDVRTAGLLATDPFGCYFARRSESPAVREVDDDTIETRYLDRPVQWCLGPPGRITWEGREVYVRPFYEKGGSRAMAGFVVLEDKEHFKKIAIGRMSSQEIDPQTIYLYVPSLPERIRGFEAQVGLQRWVEEEPRVQAPLDLARLPQPNDTRWQPDIDGTLIMPPTGGESGYVGWEDKAGFHYQEQSADGRTYLLKRGNDRHDHLFVEPMSLPDWARTRRLAGSEGEWMQETDLRPDLPPFSRRVPIEGAEGAYAWTDVGGSLHVYVPSANGISAGDLHIPSGGTWRYVPGADGMARALSALDAPFYRRRALVIPPDLASWQKEAGGTVTTEVRPRHGGTDVWRSFHLLRPGADDRELVATYMQPESALQGYGMEEVSLSIGGVNYEIAGTELPTRWHVAFVAPTGMRWLPGEIPASLRAYFPGRASQATYAYDPATDRFFLRIIPEAGDTILFFSDTTAAEDNSIANAMEQDHAATWVPMAEGLPSEIVCSLPGYRKAPGSFHLANGQWSYRETSVGEIKLRIAQIRNSSLYTEILEPEVTLKMLQDDLAAHGERLMPDSEVNANIIPYGGMEFEAYTLSLDPSEPDVIPALVVLRAAKTGVFTDPQRHDAPKVHLAAGTLLILQHGMKAVAEQRRYLAAAQPHLVRVFQTIDSLKKMLQKKLQGDLAGARPEADALPSLFGAGARDVRGRWYKQRRQIRGESVWEWTFFQVGSCLGRVQDPMTGRTVRMDPGSVWALENSELSTERYVAFNTGQEPAWFLASIGLQTSIADYEADAHERKRLHATLYPSRSFLLPGTSLRGHLMLPTEPDLLAPTLFVAEQNGTLKTNPVLGKQNVTSGDVLVWQQPVGFQQWLRNGPCRPDMQALYLPAPASLASICDSYKALPSDCGDRFPRRLWAGRPQRAFLPGFPESARVIVYLDPYHLDSPIVMQVCKAPQAGANWTLPGLKKPLRLFAGQVLLPAPTLAQTCREIDHLNGKEEYLQESVWDLNSTLSFGQGRYAARSPEGKSRPATRFRGVYGKRSATYFEDLADPATEETDPAMNLVVFDEPRALRGMAAVYRRSPSLASLHKTEEYARAWAVAYPRGPIGQAGEPLVLWKPVHTQMKSIPSRQPFTESGVLRLTDPRPDLRSVMTLQRAGKTYVVTPNRVQGAVLLVRYHPAEVLPIDGPPFAVPALGGISRANDLETARQPNAPSPNLALVRAGPDGKIDGEIILQTKALEWVARYREGYGYIQLVPGVHCVDVDGRRRASARSSKLAGWVGIGNGPHDVPFDWVRNGMVEVRDRAGHDRWMLKEGDDPPFATIIFGVKAAQYWRKHPNLDWKPDVSNSIARLIPLASSPKPFYVRDAELKECGNRLQNIYEYGDGRCIAISWDEGTRRWHRWVVDPTTLQLVVDPVPIDPHIVPYENGDKAPYGVVNYQGEVVARIRFRPDP